MSDISRLTDPEAPSAPCWELDLDHVPDLSTLTWVSESMTATTVCDRCFLPIALDVRTDSPHWSAIHSSPLPIGKASC